MNKNKKENEILISETTDEKQNIPELDQSVFDHTGHRMRLKAFYMKNGIDVLKDYEILEMLLFYAIPRKDTRVIARRLLNCFGSLADVMDADLRDLARIGGMSENSALLIKMIPDICGQYALSRKEEKPCLDSFSLIESYMADYFIGKTSECYYLLSLDNAACVIRCVKMAEGETNHVVVNVKKIGLEIAASGASSVVIAHNHPKGLALPSKNDIEVTEKIADIAEELGARLLDHLIYSPTESFSMVNSNRFYHCFFHGDGNR